MWKQFAFSKSSIKEFFPSSLKFANDKLCDTGQVVSVFHL